ncbi:MAG: hypothetical protein V4819_24140 [Verrucomicrobiota bacterium]
MSGSLEALGASKIEREEIKALIKKSKDDIHAAEKAHFRLRLVTPDHIEIETKGIWDAIATIRGNLQNGIRAALKPEAAEILLSAIDWESFYPTDERSSIRSLEIYRDESVGLVALVKPKGGRLVEVLPIEKFPDDGTPLPADQIFSEPWKTYLKGLTIVPKRKE